MSAAYHWFYAHQAGEAAYDQGLLPSANPWKPHEPERAAWRLGWLDAQSRRQHQLAQRLAELRQPARAP